MLVNLNFVTTAADLSRRRQGLRLNQNKELVYLPINDSGNLI